VFTGPKSAKPYSRQRLLKSVTSALLKVVYLSPAAQRGGAETVLLDLMTSLRKARPLWSIHLLAGEDGPLLKSVRTLGIPCEVMKFPSAIATFGEDRRLPRPGHKPHILRRLLAKTSRIIRWINVGPQALLYTWKMRNRLRRLRPDIVHSNGMKMHFVGALASGDAALVWHLHDYLGARRMMKKILRPLSKRCRLLIANSDSVAQDARSALPAHLLIRTVHNAVDLDRFTPEGPALNLDALAALPPAAPGTVRVGLVATFAFWKGHEVFLRAASAYKDATEVRFYVIGGPIYTTGGSQYSLEQLTAMAGELGLGDRVGFTGFVEDVPAAMRALDVVVHASTEAEPFGLVIVQAMACRRAVIVSAAGGALELIEPETDAITHPAGDVSALAEAMLRLIRNPELRARLGKAARRGVERKFTNSLLAEAMAIVYTDTVVAAS
jgi:glycosyltransferase involved in cell wall biosynthesis